MSVCQGAGRIDLAMIGNTLGGFEIKAERDDLSRLRSQVATFGLVFDRLTLVTVPRHLESAADAVPTWWGLRCVESDGSIVIFRAPEQNLSVDPMAVAGLLWRDEALTLLRARGRRGPRGTRRDFCRELVKVSSPDEIRSIVAQTLRERSSWRAAG
ncbi:MAG: sce7726 family protein [Candidatus Limnocylindrales bacterium]